MQIALIHDFLLEYGGAERVVEALHQLFPEAPLYIAFYNLEKFFGKKDFFTTMQLRPTYLHYLPLIKKIYSPLRLLSPHAFSRLDLSSYQVIISSSNSYHAKAVRVPAQAWHFCYCHTPARSLYGYNTSSHWQKNKITHFLGRISNHFLRQIDFCSAQKIDIIIANSKTVQERIKQYWRREAELIYPPVNLIDQTKNYSVVSKKERKYFLFVGRLNYAKHPELALQACLDLNLPLKIIGQGPLMSSLENILKNYAHKHQIELLGVVKDEDLINYYAHAQALIFPAEDEDFGIAPVEAMALGTPVLAHRSGGPLETITEHQSGLFFDDLTVSSLKKSLLSFQHQNFDYQFIHQSVQKFSQQNFQEKILALIENTIKNSNSSK